MKKSFINDFPPKISGMHSYEFVDGKPVLEPSIKFYEPGHQNLFGFEIFKLVLADRSKSDIKEIYKRNQKLTKRFLEGLSDNVEIIGDRSLDHRSSIVYLSGSEKLHRYLTSKGFISSFRGGNVRISFHYDNKKKQIDKALEVINSYFK